MQWKLFIHKKKEILPLAKTWTDHEGMMLSEMSNTETYTVWSHLHMESKKRWTQKQREQWLPGAGKWGDVGQKEHTSNYKIKKLYGMVTMVHSWKLLYKKKKIAVMWGDAYVN